MHIVDVPPENVKCVYRQRRHRFLSNVNPMHGRVVFGPRMILLRDGMFSEILSVQTHSYVLYYLPDFGRVKPAALHFLRVFVCASEHIVRGRLIHDSS